MTKKQKQAKLEKLLKAFNEGHSKLKHIKEEMRLLRIEINAMPTLTDIRPDEINMKE